MKSTQMLLVLLMLSWAASATLEDTIKTYTRDGETLETRAIATEYGDYSMAIINGKDSMLFSSGGTPIEDPLLVYAVLKSEYLANNKVAVDSQRLIQIIDEFNASREPQESTCEQYTGTDSYPCTDFATCRYSCLSVPLCRGTFEGYADVFIYAIQAWRTKTGELDKAVVGFRDSASAIAQNPEQATSASSYLTAVEEKANEIKEAKLFTCESGGYCFCYAINFTFSKLNEGKDGLAQINAVLDKLPQVEKNANVIAGIAGQRIREKNANDIVYQYQETYSKVKVNVTWVKEQSAYALSLVKSIVLYDKVALSVNISDEMSLLGEAKNYSGALLLSDSYFDSAKSAELYAAKLIQSYAIANETLSSLKTRLDLDINLTSIGDHFAGEYTAIRLELDFASAALKPPAQETQFKSLEQNLTVLSSRLTAIENSGRSALALLEQAEIAKTNLSRLSKNAADYQQGYNLGEIESAINTTITGAKSARFLEAEESLKTAHDKTAEYERQLSEIMPVIDTAKAEYGSAVVYFDEKKGASFLFLNADASHAQSLCKQASDSIYSSPRDSVHFSGECKNAIDSELQGLEYKKYGVIVAVIVLLYLFYLWARKRDWGFVVG